MEKKKYQHSTTVYQPRKNNEYFARAIKARARDKFGIDDVGKGSKYILDLVKKDLASAGLMTKQGEPIMSKLEDLEKQLDEEAKKPKY